MSRARKRRTSLEEGRSSRLRRLFISAATLAKALSMISRSSSVTPKKMRTKRLGRPPEFFRGRSRSFRSASSTSWVNFPSGGPRGENTVGGKSFPSPTGSTSPLSWAWRSGFTVPLGGLRGENAVPDCGPEGLPLPEGLGQAGEGPEGVGYAVPSGGPRGENTVDRPLGGTEGGKHS